MTGRLLSLRRALRTARGRRGLTDADLGTPPREWLVYVLVAPTSAADVDRQLGEAVPIRVVELPQASPPATEILIPFDATSREIAERMGRRACERVGLTVLTTKASRA